jgi:hypothetical protein
MWNFDKGLVAGGADELLENCRFVTGLRSIQKPLTATRWDRRLFRILPVGSHAHPAAWNPNHVQWCRLLGTLY